MAAIRTFTYPAVSLTSSPIQYNLDGVATTVSKDTVTPANSRPLPVELMGTAGPINITAGDLNVQLSDQGANPDVTRIGDGTTQLGITVSNEAKVADSAARASLASIDGKLTSPLAVTGPLTDVELRASAVPVSLSSTTITGTVAVSAAALPLPSGASTETTLSALNAKVTAVDTGAVVVASSALPTGAATETTLSALNTKVVAVDTGAVVVASSALPTGAATETTLAAVNTKLPANLTVTSTRLLVDGSGVTQPISGTVTTAATQRSKVNLARNDYGSVNVTTGAYVTLVASTSAQATLLEIFDSSGQTLVLATGAAASEVDQLYVNPGGNGQVQLLVPAGTRVSIKAVTASATSGYINLTLYS